MCLRMSALNTGISSQAWGKVVIFDACLHLQTLEPQNALKRFNGFSIQGSRLQNQSPENFAAQA